MPVYEWCSGHNRQPNKYLHSILPALAFSLDMFTKTDSSYGVNEVLLASVLGSVVFAVFACQPLVIVGVTGNQLQDECFSKAKI